MDNILSKLLLKKGIKNVDELTEEERADFENWRKILKEEDVSVKGILGLCEVQLAKIEMQFEEVGKPDVNAKDLILLHTVYSKIINLINSPKVAREALIKQLESQI